LLVRAEGRVPASAIETIVKGALESELPVASIAAARRAPFDSLARLAPDEATQRVLGRHGLELVLVDDAVRALAVALRQARNNRCGLALFGNDQLPSILPSLQAALPLRRMPEAGVVLVVEDDPLGCPAICPRRSMAALGLPIVEPSTVDGLRDAVEHAARLSRIAHGPAAIVVHASLLRSIDTLEARPNRVLDALDAATVVHRPRRGPKAGEQLDLLRLARRLELNGLASLPSPGEREPLGIIAAGPAAVAVGHLLDQMGLGGRVPVLRLGLTSPVDGASVERLLARCDRALVLESRPGAIAALVLECAEEARRRGERLATVFATSLPDPAVAVAEGEIAVQPLGPDDAISPSTLARKILPLLQELRPGRPMAERLASVPEELRQLDCPRRGGRLGAIGAIELVREILVDVDQGLRAQAAADPETVSLALAIDGVMPLGEFDRVVSAEIWDRRRFASEGVAAVRQACRDGRARVAVVPDVGADDDLDVERLVRSAIPADRAERAGVTVANLADRDGLREAIRKAAGLEACTVIVVRDGPPARFDPPAVERSLAEVDRLGFMPFQRLLWPADVSCEIHAPSTEWLIERGIERGGETIEGRWTVEPMPFGSSRIRITARPILEQVEIVRTRPPTFIGPGGPGGSGGLAPPRPVHGTSGAWRAHLAGWRGEAPGVVAAVLVEAGYLMGYRVQCVHSAAPIGPGRRAWAQVLFTRDPHAEFPAGIPYGEADLVLGIDAVESLRALGPDPALRVASAERTAAIVNRGELDDQFEESSAEAIRALQETIASVTLAEHTVAAPFAAATRARFLTERVTDLVLLGFAYQRGLVPVTFEAIDAAVRGLEARGFGRSLDAFDQGRRLAADPRRLARIEEDDEIETDAGGERLVRRLLLETRSSGLGGRGRARRLAALVERAFGELPSLDASEEGRSARRDFLVALQRCQVWGGTAMAERYLTLLGELERSPLGRLGPDATRNAVRPLAEALLIRDLVHLARMSTSLEHRRRTRRRLAVRRARGDGIERRYLNRIEITGFGKRARLDFRSSDWPARALAIVAPLVPESLRGTLVERELRGYVIDLVERFARDPLDGPAGAESRLATLARLERLCRDTGGFRGMSASEVKLRVEGFERG
jgi:indolepyruvate ferredoxin oxidoreductase